jgi:hypothetical protein
VLDHRSPNVAYLPSTFSNASPANFPLQYPKEPRLLYPLVEAPTCDISSRHFGRLSGLDFVVVYFLEAWGHCRHGHPGGYHDHGSQSLKVIDFIIFTQESSTLPL